MTSENTAMYRYHGITKLPSGILRHCTSLSALRGQRKERPAKCVRYYESGALLSCRSCACPLILATPRPVSSLMCKLLTFSRHQIHSPQATAVVWRRNSTVRHNKTLLHPLFNLNLIIQTFYLYCFHCALFPQNITFSLPLVDSSYQRIIEVSSYLLLVVKSQWRIRGGNPAMAYTVVN